MLGEIEEAFIGPYCARLVSVLLDTSVPEQTYIEDCEICCNPMQIAYAIEEGSLVAFESKSIDQ